jgi:hypothetical protein
MRRMYKISAGGDNARGIQRRSGWLLAMGSIHIVELGAGDGREAMPALEACERPAKRRVVEVNRIAA